MNYIILILFAWLLADFISGVVHWWEDKILIGESRFSFINRIKADNDLHHLKPAALTQVSLWQNINTSAYVAWPLAIVLFLFSCPKVICLAIFFASFGNAVHRYAHMPKARVPKIIRLFQWTGLFVTFKHHAKHHFDKNGIVKKEESRIKYCPMTSWLNPWLDRLHFFETLEWFLSRRCR